MLNWIRKKRVKRLFRGYVDPAVIDDIWNGKVDLPDVAADAMPPVQCCFCGETIEERPLAVLTAPVPGGGNQLLWSHRECLADRFHPSVPNALRESES